MTRPILSFFHSIILSLPLLLLTACQDDPISDKSIFPTTSPQRDNFDQWLIENYTNPYNVAFKYKMEDIESDKSYNLVPADSARAAKLAIIVRYMWFDVYDELVGQEFLKKYVPKTIHLIGSYAYNSNGTFVMGTAEGGMKVTLYGVNWLTDEILHSYADLNEDYFQTMHHEFTHILNQTTPYNTDFDYICEGKYVTSNWYLIEDAEARPQGFVSAYAMDEGQEDFAETLSIYITSSKVEWADLLLEAGSTGAALINQKLDIVRDYMQNVWSIDIDALRDIIQRRGKEMTTLDLTTL